MDQRGHPLATSLDLMYSEESARNTTLSDTAYDPGDHASSPPTRASLPPPAVHLIKPSTDSIRPLSAPAPEYLLPDNAESGPTISSLAAPDPTETDCARHHSVRSAERAAAASPGRNPRSLSRLRSQKSINSVAALQSAIQLQSESPHRGGRALSAATDLEVCVAPPGSSQNSSHSLAEASAHSLSPYSHAARHVASPAFSSSTDATSPQDAVFVDIAAIREGLAPSSTPEWLFYRSSSVRSARSQSSVKGEGPLETLTATSAQEHPAPRATSGRQQACPVPVSTDIHRRNRPMHRHSESSLQRHHSAAERPASQDQRSIANDDAGDEADIEEDAATGWLALMADKRRQRKSLTQRPSVHATLTTPDQPSSDIPLCHLPPIPDKIDQFR